MIQTLPLRERLERRLMQLEAEFDTGQQVLADLDAQRAALRDTLLRLVGAISVLKEELARVDGHQEQTREAADARSPG
jgi:predicted nuclease with TOPRIM domain